MRKIKGIVLLVAMLFLAGITFVYAGVNDSTLVKHRYENIYSVYDEGDRVRLFYAQRYTLNGVTAYCIERGVSIDTDIYSSTTDWNVTGLNNDIKRYIRLLAYYGYDYDGHNTMEYYLATQELIWEKISGKTTYWVKGASVDSPRLDISKEKQIIEDLVSKHTTVPSFDSEVVEINIGETTTLNDSNNVLSQYEIYNSNLDGVKIENNSLKITASNLRGEEEIQLIRKNYMTKVTLIYHSGDNQKLISAGVLDPVIATVKVKSLAGSIELSKKDSQTGLTPQGDGVLDGAKYGIYNSNNELVDTIITGEKNKTKDIPYGKYTIKEIEASKGYELDANIYNVTIDSNNKDIVLDVYENIIKRKVNFFKVYATDKTSILVGEPNVQFDIYLKSTNELYKSIITDKDGYAQVELVYGTYVVKQVTSTENYEKVDDFEIVINTSDEEPINELISNAEIKAKLKVIKIDEETGKVINRSNIKFKIKDVKSNEYVCQRIFYPEVIDVCEYSTNELGEFITPYPLLSGKYKLEEIDQVIDDYLWNKESVEFEIGEKSNFINDEELGILFEVKFSNKRVKGQVEINKFGEYFNITNDTYEYIKNNLEGVEFGLYANEDITTSIGEVLHKKDELVSNVTTNENGYAVINNLELGKYYIKELNTLDSFILNTNKYEFELTYKDQYTEIVSVSFDIENYLQKGILEFTKTDISTSDPLPNAKIEIYYVDEDNEDGKLVFSDYTNEQGQIIIDDLKVGKYYILEKEAPEGYKLNEERMYFEIKENGEVVKATMVDERIVIEVPNTGITNYYVVEIISILLVVGGIGVIIYDKKKKRKK